MMQEDKGGAAERGPPEAFVGQGDVLPQDEERASWRTVEAGILWEITGQLMLLLVLWMEFGAILSFASGGPRMWWIIVTVLTLGSLAAMISRIAILPPDALFAQRQRHQEKWRRFPRFVFCIIAFSMAFGVIWNLAGTRGAQSRALGDGEAGGGTKQRSLPASYWQVNRDM